MIYPVKEKTYCVFTTPNIVPLSHNVRKQFISSLIPLRISTIFTSEKYTLEKPHVTYYSFVVRLLLFMRTGP
jgi:hypothetical protein